MTIKINLLKTHVFASYQLPLDWCPHCRVPMIPGKGRYECLRCGACYD